MRERWQNGEMCVSANPTLIELEIFHWDFNPCCIRDRFNKPDLVLDVGLLLLQPVLPLHVHQLGLAAVQVILESEGRYLETILFSCLGRAKALVSQPWTILDAGWSLLKVKLFYSQ